MQMLVSVNKEPMVKLTFVPHSQPAMSVRSPEWELPWNRVLRAMSEDEDEFDDDDEEDEDYEDDFEDEEDDKLVGASK